MPGRVGEWENGEWSTSKSNESGMSYIMYLCQTCQLTPGLGFIYDDITIKAVPADEFSRVNGVWLNSWSSLRRRELRSTEISGGDKTFALRR